MYEHSHHGSNVRTALRRSAVAVTTAMLLVACGSDATSDATQDTQPAVDDTATPAATNDTDRADATEAETPGSALLDGVVPTVSGSQVDLASFAGQDVLVWVWAPW